MNSLRLAASLALLAAPARALETAQFLNVGAGARGLAMGGAYTALADDVTAVYWNPAGLPALEKREFSASHAELTRSTRHEFLAFAQPAKRGAFAASFTYLSYGALDGRDALGRPTGDFHASDAAGAVAYGLRAPFCDIGVALKYVRSHVASAEAQTFAGDVGIGKSLGPVRLGATVRNLGPGLKYDRERDDLPLRIAAGAAYRFEGGHAVAAELINGPRGTGTDGAAGAEYQAVKNVFLRGGYSSQSAVDGGSGFEAARGLTLGLGYRDERWELSYAVLPMGELGNTHRFTLGARF